MAGMVSQLLRQSLFAIGLGATALCSSACTVYARPAPPVAVVQEPVVEDGYEPQYYDGAVVYYDEGGRPYYYNEGAVVWISPGYVGYGALVGHWRANRVAYARWYGHRGYTYRTYRRGRR
jgi:hypothetical protein